MKIKLGLLSVSTIAIAFSASVAFADVIEIFDCNGKEKVAVANTVEGRTGNIVVNLGETTAKGITASLTGMNNDVTKNTVATSNMVKFNNVPAGKYKLCSADGVLAFDSINMSGAGVAAAGAAGAGLAGATGAGAGGIGLAGAAGIGLAGAGVVVGANEIKRNSDDDDGVNNEPVNGAPAGFDGDDNLEGGSGTPNN